MVVEWGCSVRRMESLLNICYFTAKLHAIYGVTFFVWGRVCYAETDAGFVD